MADSPSSAAATATPRTSSLEKQPLRHTGPITRAAAARQRLAGAGGGSTGSMSMSISTPPVLHSSPSLSRTPVSKLKSNKENVRPSTSVLREEIRGRTSKFSDVMATPSKPMMGTPYRRSTRRKGSSSKKKKVEYKVEEEKKDEGEKSGDDDDLMSENDDSHKGEITPATSEDSSEWLEEQQQRVDNQEGEKQEEKQSKDTEISSTFLLSPPRVISETTGTPTGTSTSAAAVVSSLSRSPSPAGLIPLHERYRRFIHRHEIPRKFLHVSIGFVTLNFYRLGIQTYQITPWLMTALIPIATLDLIRHRFAYFNHLYIQVVGALMRESEVKGYNGVIWYILGAWTVLHFFPKDVGVMGVLLLSWCDTAASTFGRAWGKYTRKLRAGKSLAGTAAAFITGFMTAFVFWGWFVPRIGKFESDPPHPLMFSGRIQLVPSFLRDENDDGLAVTGCAALAMMGLWTGFVAAMSELIDVFGWDDNLTIPVLSGLGLWGFLKVFG
ncbi:hypothetical protein KEM54_002056 [Ascosphaera aggregata]|nr:hypothetical protein KEM54_002056 [Ascosphaera aggregata]